MNQLWSLTNQVKSLTLACKHYPGNVLLVEELRHKATVLQDALRMATLALPNRYGIAEVDVRITLDGVEDRSHSICIPGKAVEVVGFLEDDVLVRFVSIDRTYIIKYSSIL